MNRYKFLASNTILLLISTFSSKFLSFLIMPLYTEFISTAENGSVSLIVQTVNLLIPFVSLGISNSIIRFGLDEKYSKKGVFTSGAITLFFGYIILIICYPLLNMIEFINQYIWILYLYLLMSCSRTLVQQFTRARGYIRLYAADGILATANTLILIYVFLIKLKLGATGYLLAIVGADFLSVIFLSLVISAWRYFDISKVNKKLFKEMLSYCLPFVPSSMFWWITQVSDRYFITYMVGITANGIYDMSNRIPSLIAVIATVFTEAWQLSAIKESGEKHTQAFFAQVFKAYQSVVFIAGAVLILLCRPLIELLTAKSYFEAWQYVPVLILASVFSCLSSFLSSIYMVEKKGNLNLYTMMAGAVTNIGLNMVLIPKFSTQGAAIATFISYLVVFTLRAISTKKLININISVLQISINLILICLLSWAMVMQIDHVVIISIVVTIIITIINFMPLYKFLKTILQSILNKKNKH